MCIKTTHLGFTESIKTFKMYTVLQENVLFSRCDNADKHNASEMKKKGKTEAFNSLKQFAQ